ncbi:AMP-binding protein [Nocardia fluminea]|uniref:AMP-binding protein n=1 Tax=Nocardia fluminea TaxID=134984 RepID=UPI0033EF50BE
MTNRTFPEAFQQTAATYPDAVALRTPGDAVSYTWREYADAVRRIAGGFAELGVRHGDTVAAMLANRPEFHLQEAAASHLGATTFSIYNTSSVDQVRYLLEHSGAKVVITERQFLDTVEAARGTVEHILVIEDGDLDRLEPSAGFDFEAAWKAVEPDDVLCLIYTSGTTGPPKGVEHTHRTMFANIETLLTVCPSQPGDRVLSYLPAAHIADRALSQYIPISTGVQVTCLDDFTQLAAALADTQPTGWAAVPRIWQKLKSGIEAKLANDVTGVKQKLAYWAIGTGVKRAELRLSGKPVPGLLEAQYKVADALLLSKLRAGMGLGNLRWALTGGAATPPADRAYMMGIGLPICEGWGMSEYAVGACTTLDEVRYGSIGKFLPGVEGKLAEDGEILVRGAGLMRGYRNDPEKTAEAIADGWLRTGDIATMDDEGYLTIVDRKKDLIINAGGKNMSPANIEGAIVPNSRLIGTVIAIGEGAPYNVALIVLEPEAAAEFAEQHGLDADPAVLAEDERVRAAVQEAVDAGNAKLSRVEQVKKFAILPTYWEPGTDVLTPTMKVKRKPVSVKYAAEIAALYAGGQG